MVEKMSGSVGGSNRATNAIIKRGEAIAGWSNSLTGKQASVRHPEQFTIKFDKGTVFLSAVASGDLEEVENLLKEGVDIDYTNVDGLTALHQACIDENDEMVQLLLDEGANIEARDNEGWTPLHAAVSAGNVDIAKILIDENADLLAVNNEGEVPLDLAEEDEMDEYISEVMDEKSMDPDNARNEEESQMLADARSWLNKKHIDNEPLDWQGATSLHVAASKGYDKVIRLLLQINSINVNVKDNDGWTPLHAAIHWGAKEVCEQLAESGASFEIRNLNGQTPCDVADSDFVKFAENLRKQYGKKNSSDSKKLENCKPDLDIDGLLKREPVLSALKGGREAKKGNKSSSISEKKTEPKPETTKPESNSKRGSTSSTSSTSGSISINSVKNDHTTTNSKFSSVNSKSSANTNSLKNSHNSSISSTNNDRKLEIQQDNKKPATISISSKYANSYEDRKRDPSSRVPSTSSDKQSNDEAVSSRSNSLTSTTTTSSYVRDDWRKRLAKRTEEANYDSGSQPLRSNDTNETAASSNKASLNNESDSEQSVKRRTVPNRNIRQSRRPTGVVYLPDQEDENETNENEPPTTGKHSSTSESSTGRMSIADRLRIKNQEILASSDNTNTKSSSYTPSNRDRDTSSSYSTSSYSRANRTSTSTSDTGDTSSLQRKLDQALKEAEDYKQKYEKMKKEKDELEKKLEQYKDDIDKMQELKNDNIRLKDENGALIRVISKLSRTPSSSS